MYSVSSNKIASKIEYRREAIILYSKISLCRFITDELSLYGQNKSKLNKNIHTPDLENVAIPCKVGSDI